LKHQGCAGTQVEQRGLRPRPWHDVAIGLLMLVFYGLQMYIKFTRGGWNDLAWMLMPCHVYTLSLAFCLLSRNRVWVNRVFTIIPVCHAWNPIMALAFPDFSDQIFGACRAHAFATYTGWLTARVPWYW